jgi:hypothetical protein
VTDASFLYSPILFQAPLRMTRSAWIEHTPFAMWLIEKMRPRNFVELGTHTGVSFSAVNQVVKQLGLATKTYAIDTWQGDEHAGNYDEDIFQDIKRHTDEHYPAFARLMRMYFDQALDRFPDNSIDLLHIDGLHTYEAVLHDYATWLPKMRAGGVILFHDTNVKTRGFGVHQLWAEIVQPSKSFEFLHGFGLGVLCVGQPRAVALQQLCASFNRPAECSEVRRMFAYLGSSVARQVPAA